MKANSHPTTSTDENTPQAASVLGMYPDLNHKYAKTADPSPTWEVVSEVSSWGRRLLALPLWLKIREARLESFVFFYGLRQT